MRKWRFYIILCLFLVGAAAIISRLALLQIKKHDYYQALAEGQQKILETETGNRGEIFLSNGEPLAINNIGKYVFLCPREIQDKEGVATTLSAILELDKDLVLSKAKKDNLFEVIKYHLSEKEQEDLIRENLEGVYTKEESFRYYPQKTLASHIIGFLNIDKEGQYGIEGYYDETLKGKEVVNTREKGPFGFFSSINEQNSGENLFLTIEPSIQFTAKELLEKNQEKLGFDGGQILVMDPYSGAIIALAQLPDFDPNKYSEIEDQEIFQNSAIQKIFEPGSVFKPITMAGALNEKKITPQTTYVDNGIVKIGDWEIYNYDQRTWGEQTMTSVLERSINTGAVFVERELGHRLFLKYIEKFGFLEKTGIDLQGEIFSENRSFLEGYEINFANASFGQGIDVTLIQLAKAFSIIANGGNTVTPHIVKQDISENDIDEKEQVIDAETSLTLTNMLVSVVENGFGKAAQVESYYVAGKTGTAQVSWPALGIQKSGYSDKTIQTFIGFAPAYNPRFLIVVKLDDPQTKTAEYSAIPIFKELAKYIIDFWQIPPDHE